jgi:hypothetical protein
VTAAVRRLPGISFVAQPPPPAAVLPRMDVAVFVGFAASGPLHTPVAVEDPGHFAALFGDDATLAWDPDRGATAYAHLGPAVRAFFRNGGQRCWVVRVAGTAVTNWSPVPGLARLLANGSVVPAFAPARSEGSWSDALRVGATLGAEPVGAVSFAPDASVGLPATAPNDLAPGDLVRVTFAADGYVQLFAVQAVQPPPVTSPPGGVVVQARGRAALWLRPPGWRTPSAPGQLQVFAHDGPARSIPVTVPVVADGGTSPAGTRVEWPEATGDQTVSLEAACTLADAPPPGSLVRVDFGRETFWLFVQDGRAADGASPPGGHTMLSGVGFWQMCQPPAVAPASEPVVERLTFDLWVRQGDGYPVRLDGLGCAPGHPFYWGALPDDAQLCAGDPPAAAAAYPALWQAAANPRFALAGGAAPDDVFSFPLGMALFPVAFLGPDPQRGTALERDGLADFGAGLFLGEDDQTALRSLVEADTAALLGVAEFLRYQDPTLTRPRSLKGIYAALAIDETTLITVPDAVHRGWAPTTQEPAPPPADNGGTSRPGPPGFVPCAAVSVAAPTLAVVPASPQDPASGTFTLQWVAPPKAVSKLQQATRPDYTDAATLYSGTGDRFDVYGRQPGDYYYRVGVTVDGVPSDWSNRVGHRVTPPGGWQLVPVAEYRPDDLLVVQRALLRLCAARGDMLAVLALPGHYGEDAALAHVARLTSPSAPSVRLTFGSPAQDILSGPLGFGEAAALSYGAVYHPWLIGSPTADPEAVTPLPPDGAACGVLAGRAQTRGAWIAPANQPLTGVVDLSPPVAPERLADLYQAQVNVFRQDPHGFVAQGADTLSGDSDVRPINVRRLLSLLRRLALRQGPAYVFEPAGDALRRRVQQDFEALLYLLFIRGAFAGPTPAASFRVVTDTSVNRPETLGQGQFVVELRVAPALPLTFLTVRLVQSGDQGVVTEVT